MRAFALVLSASLTVRRWRSPRTCRSCRAAWSTTPRSCRRPRASAWPARSRRTSRRPPTRSSVLTVPTIGDESIEEYAVRVFAAVEARPEGQGQRRAGRRRAEGPQDAHRGRLRSRRDADRCDGEPDHPQRDDAAVQGNDFDGGIESGVQCDGRAARRRRRAGGADSRRRARQCNSAFGGIDEPDLPPWPMRILLGAFIFGIIGLFTVIGVMTPGVGWFLYLFLIPFWAMFPIMIVGVKGALVLLAIYVVGYPIAKLIVSRSAWYEKAKKDLKSKGTATIGGFTMSSGGSSSWSSAARRAARRAAASRAAAAAPAAAAARAAGSWATASRVTANASPSSARLGRSFDRRRRESPRRARARRISSPRVPRARHRLVLFGEALRAAAVRIAVRGAREPRVRASTSSPSAARSASRRRA